ncbi:type VI secretion system-associated FHA domain protein [Sorangium sp. So ce1036]|uniref:type VI secretion system-associated FHA domain protein n=1 Tax=Sorangium sp. So ce1036 TaxID=3133328 RepID=UPI003F037BE9
MPAALSARVSDTQANQSFEASFERFPVRIGRNQLNDLHIDRPYISQFHAAVDVRDRRILVRDLGSTNGTMFAGHRLARDTAVDVSTQPEITIGPIQIRLAIIEAPLKAELPSDGTLLGTGGENLSALLQSQKRAAPGVEDPYLRQVVPYLEAYRTAWAAVYRIIWEHLARLPPEARQGYLRRLGEEHPAVLAEKDFQKIAQYYGVDYRTLGELAPANAAFAALSELAGVLAPGAKPPDDVAGIVNFARRLRDTMDVFLKCFVSLRDGYYEFEEEVLARDRSVDSDKVANAKDDKELGTVLLTPAGGPDAAHQLRQIFADVMTHQMALLQGVMGGVRSLLVKLSPKTLVRELEREGKKGGLFSSKYEDLWKLYERRHGDFGEDKETFREIFGEQFFRAYVATAAEDDGSRNSNKR